MQPRSPQASGASNAPSHPSAPARPWPGSEKAQVRKRRPVSTRFSAPASSSSAWGGEDLPETGGAGAQRRQSTLRPTLRRVKTQVLCCARFTTVRQQGERTAAGAGETAASALFTGRTRPNSAKGALFRRQLFPHPHCSLDGTFLPGQGQGSHCTSPEWPSRALPAGEGDPRTPGKQKPSSPSASVVSPLPTVTKSQATRH